jgi:hypothetical protein
MTDARTEALEVIARTTFSGSDSTDDYMRGNRDAHETCAKIARAALAAAQAAAPASDEWSRMHEPWLQGFAAGIETAAGEIEKHHVDYPMTQYQLAAAIRALRPPAAPAESEAPAHWTKVSDRQPAPHAKYLLLRDDTICTATPCYGMHAPWWVPRVISGEETEPITMLDTDEWLPLGQPRRPPLSAPAPDGLPAQPTETVR